MYSIPNLSNSVVVASEGRWQPSLTFLPFLPILFIIHQPDLRRTNLNCRSCRGYESSKRWPAHTWPAPIWRLNPLSHGGGRTSWSNSNWSTMALCHPWQAVTGQFWTAKQQCRYLLWPVLPHWRANHNMSSQDHICNTPTTPTLPKRWPKYDWYNLNQHFRDICCKSSQSPDLTDLYFWYLLAPLKQCSYTINGTSGLRYIHPIHPIPTFRF